MVQDAVTIISTLGFPIGMCLILCYYIVSEQGKTREVLNNLNVIIAELKEVIINDNNE